MTHAKGPGTNDSELMELGSGPVLDIGANVHPGLYGALRDAANALEMKIGTGVHAAGSGTDARVLQVARDGIPTGVLSIPLRYMHTMVETVDMGDVERASVACWPRWSPGSTTTFWATSGGRADATGN